MKKPFKPTANDAFIRQCLRIDDLLNKANELRREHFGVDAEAGANWGHVGSAEHFADLLEQAVNHYAPADEPTYHTVYNRDGERVRVCIPGRE